MELNYNLIPCNFLDKFERICYGFIFQQNPPVYVVAYFRCRGNNVLLLWRFSRDSFRLPLRTLVLLLSWWFLRVSNGCLVGWWWFSLILDLWYMKHTLCGWLLLVTAQHAHFLTCAHTRTRTPAPSRANNNNNDPSHPLTPLKWRIPCAYLRRWLIELFELLVVFTGSVGVGVRDVPASRGHAARHPGRQQHPRGRTHPQGVARDNQVL